MLSTQAVQSAVRPLRFIFWGGILWIFDFSFASTTNGTGFRCDILDDTLGTILIAVGLFRLAAAPVSQRYVRVMRILKGIILASIVSTAIKHFIFDQPAALNFIFSALSLCQLAGVILFCLAMRWFCLSAGLPAVARSWRTTLLLFSFLYVLPLGIFYVCSLIALVSGTSFNVNLGAGGLLLLPVFAIPEIHLFVSTSRMRRAAESGYAQADPSVRGFPVVFPEDRH